MPCFTVTTVGVDLGKMNKEILLTALKDLGLSPHIVRAENTETIFFGRNESYNTVTGEARLSSMRDVAEIKRAYSAEVVKSQAMKFGWQLQQQGNKFTVLKR